MAKNTLPGENGPLAYRGPGAPVTEAEALGVARRLARRLAEGGRAATVKAAQVPDTLEDEPMMASWRVSRRTLAFARARAEMEGLPVSAIITAALEQYGQGCPGTVTVIPVLAQSDATGERP